ncbi:ectoine/hydroxyectoine ABC transporter permease subunit EhuC [Mesorhizobium sp. M0933]|uniref:ectoine/hydroxyectoine ABC transporter permease subunit EhuC n=1 Tax=Mesorhizobium sp. M0933 TaxID=2957030 RepID=UPI0033391C2B
MQNLNVLLEYGPFILEGAIVTVELTVLCSLLVLATAMAAGVTLLSRSFWLRAVARAYVELFRGTSLFVQLFAVYFILPLSGVNLSPFEAGILAIGLNGGAYGAEIVRAGIQAIGRDQREATVALNLKRWQALWYIILPQAMVLMLPSFGNLAIDVMKATAATSLITVSELTFHAQTVRMQTGQTAIPFIMIFITYLVIASVLISLVRWLERRFGRGIVIADGGA